MAGPWRRLGSGPPSAGPVPLASHRSVVLDRDAGQVLANDPNPTLSKVESLALRTTDLVTDKMIPRLLAYLADCTLEIDVNELAHLRREHPWVTSAQFGSPIAHLDLDATELQTLLAHLMQTESSFLEEALDPHRTIAALRRLAGDGSALGARVVQCLDRIVITCPAETAALVTQLKQDIGETAARSLLRPSIEVWAAQAADLFDATGMLGWITGSQDHAVSAFFVAVDQKILLIFDNQGDGSERTQDAVEGTSHMSASFYMLDRSRLASTIATIAEDELLADDEEWADLFCEVAQNLGVVRAYTRGGRPPWVQKLNQLRPLLTRGEQSGSSCVLRAVLNSVQCGLLVEELFHPRCDFVPVGRRRRKPADLVVARLPDFGLLATTTGDATSQFIDSDRDTALAIAASVLANTTDAFPGFAAQTLAALALDESQRATPVCGHRTVVVETVVRLGAVAPAELESLLEAWSPDAAECRLQDDDDCTLPMLILRHVAHAEAAVRMVSRLPLAPEDFELTSPEHGGLRECADDILRSGPTKDTLMAHFDQIAPIQVSSSMELLFLAMLFGPGFVPTRRRARHQLDPRSPRNTLRAREAEP